MPRGFFGRVLLLLFLIVGGAILYATLLTYAH